MRAALNQLLLYVVALLTLMGFFLGILLGPIVYGMLRGIEEVSAFIDRNSN